MKMRVNKSALFLLLSVFLLIGTARAEDMNYSDITEYESLIIDLNIAGEVNMGVSSKLTATLYLFPSNEAQEVLELERYSEPVTGINQNDDRIVYSWSSVKSAKFGINAKVKTKVVSLSSEKVNFPLNTEEYSEYTKPSENIDSDNPKIIAKANEIVAGKTDALKAVNELSNFVNSYLEYDEEYVTSVQKASFVLENKRGVCDEYTNLLIAFCRALNIPARYVSGVAYSNIKNNFGPHAWAEVYMPGHGWIPFDATYAQNGRVDATHVVLSRTIDTTNSVVYSYQSSVDIDTEPLSIGAEVVEKIDKIEPKSEINLRLLKNNVGVRSYVPLQVELTNPESYYLPIGVYLTKSPGLYGTNTKEIILAPGESKSVFFIVDTKDEAKEGYAYEATVEVKTSDNNKEDALLLFSKSYTEQTLLSEADYIINALTEDENEFSYDVSLKCTPDKSEFYIDEEVGAKCNIKNNGNALLNDLNLCLDGQCTTFNLMIGEEKIEKFALEKDKIDYVITLKNNEVSKTEYLGLTILQKPDIRIIDITPKEIGYNEDNIVVSLETNSICKDAIIKINSLVIKTDKINMKKDFTLPITGKNLLSEKAVIKAFCYDLRDNKYEDKKVFDLKITDVPGSAKIWQFFLKIIAPVVGYTIKERVEIN